MAEVGLPVDERYAPPARVREGALVTSREEYDRLYRRSIEDRDAFWSEMADQFITWAAPYSKVCDEDLRTGKIEWFAGGKLNVSVNCLDRHLATRGAKPALIMEGDEPGTVRQMTYQEVHDEVGRVANYLRSKGVGKGDRVAIYMGMVP